MQMQMQLQVRREVARGARAHTRVSGLGCSAPLAAVPAPGSGLPSPAPRRLSPCKPLSSLAARLGGISLSRPCLCASDTFILTFIFSESLTLFNVFFSVHLTLVMFFFGGEERGGREGGRGEGGRSFLARNPSLAAAADLPPSAGRGFQTKILWSLLPAPPKLPAGRPVGFFARWTPTTRRM